MKIGWIRISKGFRGGDIYEQKIIDALKDESNIEIDLVFAEPKIFKNIRFARVAEGLFNLTKIKGEKDLWVRDFFSTLTLPLDKTKGKNLTIIFHIDSKDYPLFFRPIFHLLKIIFYHNLKKVDAILTMSSFWQDHFLKKGYHNVFKIYTGFNIKDFNLSGEEILEFRRRFNLEKKPIIYIGNSVKKKGVIEVWRSLNDLDAYLVTSGEPQVKLPVLNINSGYKDYLRLLAASEIVITMSKFKEGWCQTAHEAMLCKTPVIGSGKGGMKELLEGGKQIICQEFGELREKVNYLLKHPKIRKEMGESGYNFAKNFTYEKFKKEWLSLIKSLNKK